MKYTAKIEQHGCGMYDQVVTFDAHNVKHLQELLDIYAEIGEGEGIVVDDSKMPENFMTAGGFASRLWSFVDENGNDFSHLGQGVLE